MGREAAPTEKVRASLLRVKFKGQGDFVIAQFRAEEGGGEFLKKGMFFSAKGTILSPAENDVYLLEGKWESSDKWGQTFKIASYERDATPPSSTEGIREFLLRKVKHIGPQTATLIVDLYGADTIKVLREQPMRVASEVKGITLERAEIIANTLISQAKEIELEIAIRSITQHADLNQRQINAILKAYGHDAPTVLKQDPYRLIEEVSGIGWKSADAIAKVVGYPIEGDARIRAGIIYTLEDAGQSQGHLYLGKEELAVQAMRNLGVALELCERGVLRGIETRDLTLFKTPYGQHDVALTQNYNNERVIADKIIRFLAEPNPGEAGAHVDALADMWLAVAIGAPEPEIVAKKSDGEELEVSFPMSEDEDDEYVEDALNWDNPDEEFEREARELDEDEEYWASREETDYFDEIKAYLEEKEFNEARDLESCERVKFWNFNILCGTVEEAPATWAEEVMEYRDSKEWID